MQGGSISQRFLGGGVRVVAGIVGKAKEPVGRRDDVFDFRTSLRFEEGN